ncbi:hypothetical protein Aduo_003360 [Ancylostoma duodenale]
MYSSGIKSVMTYFYIDVSLKDELIGSDLFGIYDCKFERAAAKEEQKPGYAEKKNYGKLTFTRTWETSVVEELTRAFHEMRKDEQALRVAGIDDRWTTIPNCPDS